MFEQEKDEQSLEPATTPPREPAAITPRQLAPVTPTSTMSPKSPTSPVSYLLPNDGSRIKKYHLHELINWLESLQIFRFPNVVK